MSDKIIAFELHITCKKVDASVKKWFQANKRVTSVDVNCQYAIIIPGFGRKQIIVFQRNSYMLKNETFPKGIVSPGRLKLLENQPQNFLKN